jgi:hypothetical protein
MRQMMMALALLGALSTAAYAQTSAPAKPKAKTTTEASHAVKGTVKAVDANMLTVAQASNKGDLMVMMNSTTTKDGTLAVGSTVSVHYKESNGQKIATAVKATPAPAPKASSSKKK